ncbi:FtsX-like permease family protein [Gemmata sp. G18]|uniref:FtsX-like permease family protein n=1 Tax=Gemmata palustris TaxID=2822762 RepID=A0ABS5BZ41_9BACT|nr:ABC transporter permease [Gemmata palustris]MBP3958991.1 FtsX-like permease family protein [Gemmata palustris]
MSVYRLLALRYLLQRWDRAALIVASIALGVATLVSARILNQCIEAAAQDTTTPAGNAELYVTNGEAGVLRSVVDDLRSAKVPGVTSVQPLIFDRVTVPDLGDRIAVLVGAEVSSQLLTDDNALKVKVQRLEIERIIGWQLLPVLAAIKDGDFTKAGELWDRIPAKLVVVSKSVYDDWLARTGGDRPFVIRYATRNVECLPVGVVEFEKDSPLAPLGKNFIGMSVGQAMQVVRPVLPLAVVGGGLGEVAAGTLNPPRVNRIDLFLAPGTDKDAAASAAADVIGRRAEVRTPDMQRRSTQEVVSGLQIGVLMCSVGAMVIGLFLVYNSMAVTVAERRADIGILRSIGGTRAQIIALFSIAAAFLGLIGAVLGVPLGILLAEITLSQFRAELESIFLNPEVNPRRLSWTNSTLAVLVGVMTAVFAALVPAIQAANDDPAHVVRRSAGGAKGLWKIAHRLACAGMVVAGVALVLLRFQLPARVGSVGGMTLVLVGLLLASPILVAVLVTVLRPLVRATCPFTLRLAFDNLSRAPGRTGVVIGALGAGVALMFQTAGVGRSNEEPVLSWITQVVQADHFVFSGNMTSANSSNSPMVSAVAREIKALPSVESVMSIRYSRPEYNGTIVYLVALDVNTYAEATSARVPELAVNLTRFPELDDKHPTHAGVNKVLVSENFTARHRVKVGDTIRVPGPRGPVDLLIIGAVRDYSWSRGTIFMDRARYAKLFGDDLIDICHVFVRTERSAAADTELEKYTTGKGLLLTDRDSLRKFISGLLSRVYLLAYMQQLLVGVVAALGVVTALLISVLQRKRELGLLLAVGATPGQVMRSVLAEAFLMGVLGTALGILIGLPMEWYVLKVMFVDESGFDLDVLIPWKATLGIAVVSVALATLAGLVPAWRAIQTRIPDALQYE